MALLQLRNWFQKAKSSQANQGQMASFYQSIYPESVRYALQYKDAEMSKDEILALVSSWHFEAVYLLMKALVYDREAQRQFLEALTRLYWNPDWTVIELQSLLRRTIEILPGDLTVTGTKLAQLSRTGTSNWQMEWQKLTERLVTEKPDALPCIMANTPIYAYHHFIQAYRDIQQEKLIILMPNWITDPDENQMGYEITLTNPPTVSLQIKKDCLYGTWTCDGVDCKLKQHFCKEAIFIDDTINTAKTAGKLQSFWLTKYGLNMPIDRIHVITNLRAKMTT